MARFFLPPPLPRRGYLTLDGENAAHAKALRLREGERVTVCDGQGLELACSVDGARAGRLRLRIDGAEDSAAEPRVRVSIFAAFSKSDKLEHVVMKATELGAHEFVAFPSARCVSRPDGPSLARKLERWQKIAASAAGQSGRGRIPAVSAARSCEEALRLAAGKDLPIFLYENERRASLRGALTEGEFQTVSLVAGPEGGFTPEEAGAAREAGLRICTLGPRILRCETAPLCALSAILFACGELD